MAKRNRLRDGRRKAAFGADGAVMAAATLAAAGINAAATASSASQQARAMESAARTQADSIRLQTENANKLQEKSLAFTKEQNEVNRDLQKDIQMNLQILAGQQTLNDIKDASKIQVKHGGSMRRKLRNSASLLKGRNGNLSFTVTDGGSVIPIGTTPEGYDLYEIIGNDHEHYHKAQGGRNKTGVGIKFANSSTIEGEGNQNSNQGELMLVTPNDAKFISKHSLKGYNPAQAVLAGQDPLEAFAIQERIKDIYGISDDGKHQSTSPVRKNRPYGGITTLPITPDLSLDYLAPVATGVVAGTRQLKCGGRHKAAYGYSYGKPPYGDLRWLEENSGFIDTNPIYATNNEKGGMYIRIPNDYNKSTTGRGMTTAQGNLLGAGINAGSNLIAGGINMLGNYLGARQLANAQRIAANITEEAYRSLPDIDMNLINKNDFRSAHAMAALQVPIVHTGAERSAAERTLQRNLGRINRGTLSSAAAQNRSARSEVDYNDRIAQVESNADRLRQGILQENMARITQVSNENANRDIQANQAYANAYLQLLNKKFEREEYKHEGITDARVQRILGPASTLATMRTSNAQHLANAINTGGNAFGSAFVTNAKMQNDLDMTLSGGTDESVIRSILGSNGSSEYRNAARGIYERYKDGNEDQRRIAEKMNRLYHFTQNA